MLGHGISATFTVGCCLLQVVLAAKPRPVPEMMVVITDPAAGIRPDVPAGYGTGFEHGRIPFCLLHKPRALGAAGGRSFKNSQAGAAESGSVLMDQQLMLLESKLHRPHTQPCQVCHLHVACHLCDCSFRSVALAIGCNLVRSSIRIAGLLARLLVQRPWGMFSSNM